MTPAELKNVAHSVLGYGWYTRLAELLDVHPYTVSAWARGKTPISRIHAIAIMWVLSQAAEERDGGSAGNSPSA